MTKHLYLATRDEIFGSHVSHYCRSRIQLHRAYRPGPLFYSSLEIFPETVVQLGLGQQYAPPRYGSKGQVRAQASATQIRARILNVPATLATLHRQRDWLIDSRKNLPDGSPLFNGTRSSPKRGSSKLRAQHIFVPHGYAPPVMRIAAAVHKPRS